MERELSFQSSPKLNRAGYTVWLAAIVVIFQWLSMPLKVFVRRHFGERYFSFAGISLLLIILGAAPIPFLNFDRIGSSTPYHPEFEWGYFLGHFASWYLAIWLCFRQCLKRREEVKREPGVFELQRYSYASGTLHPLFFTLFRGDKFPTIREVKIFREPLFFVAVGLGLLMLGQYIGAFITVSALLMSARAAITYNKGDHWVMDLLDRIIEGKSHMEAFCGGEEYVSATGYSIPGRRPADPELRRKLAGMMMGEEAEATVS